MTHKKRKQYKLYLNEENVEFVRNNVSVPLSKIIDVLVKQFSIKLIYWMEKEDLVEDKDRKKMTHKSHENDKR